MWETLYNLMTESHSLRGPMFLVCDLHQCFLAFFSFPRETGWLWGLELTAYILLRWDSVLVSFLMESCPL